MNAPMFDLQTVATLVVGTLAAAWMLVSVIVTVNTKTIVKTKR
jgi:hypothetical protein